MVVCALKNCKNRSSQKTLYQISLEARGKITFHRFPKNEDIRKEWLRNLGLTEASLLNNPFLCSAHFREDAFDRTSVNRIQLRPGSIPEASENSSEVDDSSRLMNNNESKEIAKVELDQSRLIAPVKTPGKVFSPKRHRAKNVQLTSTATLVSVNESDQGKVEDSFATKQVKIKEMLSQEEAVIDVPDSSYSDLDTSIKTTSRSTSVSPDRFPQLPKRPEYVDKGTSVCHTLNFNTPEKCQLRAMLREQATKHSTEIKLLKQKCRRKEDRIASLQETIKKLKK